MKYILVIIIALGGFFHAGYTEQTPEKVQISELSPEELVEFLPVPTSQEEYMAQEAELLADPSVSGEAYLAYSRTYQYTFDTPSNDSEIETEILDAVAQFVEEGGVSMVTRIKVDPVAYAGLMTAAGAPEGTDLETGIQFDPEGDQVLINYGQPGEKPAVTVMYNITDMIEQYGYILSRFEPGIADEVPEVVAQWQDTRQDIVEHLAQPDPKITSNNK